MGLKSVKYTLLFFLIINTSCIKNKEKKTYYEDGNLESVFYLTPEGKKIGEEKVFYSTGQIKALTYYNNGIFDSIIKFNKDSSLESKLIRRNNKLFIQNYKSNEILEEGYINEKTGDPVGWWKFYKNNDLYMETETISIGGEPYANQQKFLKNGTVVMNKSRLYNFSCPDSIKKGKQYSFQILFEFNEIDTKENLLDKVYYYLLISPELKEDFSNINTISLDTIIPKQNNMFEFTLEFKNSGEKKLNGVIEKHILVGEKEKLIINKSRLYVKEKFVVY